MPFDVSTLPEVLGATPVTAEVPAPTNTEAEVSVVAPVPPLVTGSVPVTPVVNGSPVALVSTPAEGVPMSGVVSTGLVANTNKPEPVSSVTAAARFALDGVAKNVDTPAPSDAVPVPPLAVGNVPVTPVVSGSPVALVSTPAEGVPRA